MRFISTVLQLLLVALLAAAAVLSLSLGLGWLLAQLLPFTWFEATLITMLAELMVIMMGASIINIVTRPRELDDLWDESEEYESEPHIPEERFWPSEADRTWNNWFRFLIANTLYANLIAAEGWIGELETQRQEQLAIELADISLETIKSKARRGRTISVSRRTLQRALEKQGQRPYDDKLLNLSVAAINGVLVSLAPTISRVTHEDKWEEQADSLL